MQDQRRWLSKSGYTSRGIRAQRVVCSRSGTEVHNLMHLNARTSPKCKCLAAFKLYDGGKTVFKNEHYELCLPDPNMDNDGYVLSMGLNYYLSTFDDVSYVVCCVGVATPPVQVPLTQEHQNDESAPCLTVRDRLNLSTVSMNDVSDVASLITLNLTPAELRL